MTLKDIGRLTPIPCEFGVGYLIRVDNYSGCSGTIFDYKGIWFIGILHKLRSRPEWACSLLVLSMGGVYPRPIQLSITELEEFTASSSTDIPRYLNYLTDSGVNYLKGLCV